MGVSGLIKFLQETYNLSRTETFMDLKRKGISVIGIDAPIYLYQSLGNEDKMKYHITQICNKLLEYDILPFFVFDGRFDHSLNENRVDAYELKRKTVQKRKDSKIRFRAQYEFYRYIYEVRTSQILTDHDFYELIVKYQSEHEDIDLLDDEQIASFFSMDLNQILEKMDILEKKTWYVGHEHLDMCRTLLDFYGVPYAFSYYEADSLLADLCKKNIIQAVISEDSDLLAYGTPILIRDFNFYSNEVNVYYYEEILSKLHLTNTQFLDMCILFGTDYNNRIKKLKPEESYEHIVQYENIENIFHVIFTEDRKRIPKDLNYEKVRKIYRQTFESNEIQKIRNMIGFSDIQYKIYMTRRIIERVIRKINLTHRSSINFV